MIPDPTTHPLMRFVLVMHDPTQNGSDLLKSVRNFAAPRILLTSNPDEFWNSWKSGLVEYSRVFVDVNENIPAAVQRLVEPWAGKDAASVWVVYLPHSFIPRPTPLIQSFLQFVGVQPPEIQCVQSIRPATPDTRTLIRFTDDGSPMFLTLQENEPGTFELTDAFLAWRLLSDPKKPNALSANAYWTHE